MPNTLTALPSSQYATDFSLTCGKLDDFALGASSKTARTIFDDENDLLDLNDKNCFEKSCRRPVWANDRPANCLRNGALAALFEFPRHWRHINRYLVSLGAKLLPREAMMDAWEKRSRRGNSCAYKNGADAETPKANQRRAFANSILKCRYTIKE